jgi:hypothetical protein
MSWKKGWIENRQSGASKVSQLVEFRVIPAAEFQHLAGDALYAHTTLRNPAIARLLGQLLHCEASDLFNGSVHVCGQDPTQQGQHLEVQLELKSYNTKLKFIVEAIQVHFDAEMKEMVFSAGMKAIAVNKDDMDLLNRIIELKKKVSG